MPTLSPLAELGKRQAVPGTVLNLRYSAGEFQITTDGFKRYVDALEYSLGTRVDFAQLIKVYSTPREGEQRYSPAAVVDAVPVPQWRDPNPDKICTSHVERQNLRMRMAIRALTRLTNASSFVRPHSSLRVAPAMEAGVTDHVWSMGELLL
jgi:hypothetical protein